VNIYREPLIKNIASYIYKVHIADDYYVNFADASAIVHPNSLTVYRFGKKCNDADMMNFGAYLFRLDDLQVPLRSRFGAISPVLFDLYAYAEVRGAESHAPLPEKTWMPDIQVMTNRVTGGSTRGLFLAAKGGHNDESHNHNDVGNFIVYYDGFPVLIDAGVEEYTSKTFSDRRYEIWTMQSQYHNLPTINGYMQLAGRQQAASKVHHESTNTHTVLSLDLSKAYPKEALIKYWNRRIEFTPRRILINDDFELYAFKEPTIMNLVTAAEPEFQEPGVIKLQSAGSSKLMLKYQPESLEVKLEAIDISDQRLLPVWGEKIYRIRLVSTEQITSGDFKLKISKE
jgi:hypothetical protein